MMEGEKYNLVGEFNSLDKYHKTAKNALIYATEHNFLDLEKEAIILADLIEDIPYDHDDFYKVASQEKKVSDMMNSYVARTNHHEIEHATWKHNDVWECNVWECNDKTYGASVGFHRLPKELNIKLPDSIKEIINSNNYKHTHDETNMGSGSVHAYDEYLFKKTSKSSDLPAFIRIETLYHENQKDIGHIVSFFGISSEEKAKVFLNKLLSSKK